MTAQLSIDTRRALNRLFSNYIVFIILFGPLLSLGQECVGQSREKAVKIQEINLVDSIVLPVLKVYIDSLEENNKYWTEGKGYLEIYISDPETSDPKEFDNPPARKYTIYPELLDFDADQNRRLPLFYTKVAGRIGTIWIENFYDVTQYIKGGIDKKSQKKFRKLIEPYLFKKIYGPMRDMEGNIIEKRIGIREKYMSYLHPLHLEITVYEDGSTNVVHHKHY